MEQEESQAMLEALERANLFVVALDDERRWYRYHQLFVEVLRSHLQQARGNSHEALATLDALAHLTEQRHFSARVMTQVDAERAQLKLAQGDLAAGLRWAVSSGLSTSDEELPYSREGAYLALARVRIVQVRDGLNGSVLQKVLSLLDRLLKDAESKTRQSSVLEILILCALALEVRGDRTGALSTLERALVLAAIGMK
jgi:LuxR family maltose regulon positive regulatory protein